MPVEKKCVVCGKQFFVPPIRANTAKACSNECGYKVRGKTNQKRTEVSCENCGKKLSVPDCHASRTRFCSKDCQFSSKTYLREMSERTSGERNPMWAGGKASHSRGYVQSICSGHPFAVNGYVFEHRLVAESWLASKEPSHPFLVEIEGQKYLRPEYAVHHVNEVKTDNRAENLVICTQAAHRAMHSKAPVGKNEVWPVCYATEEFVDRLAEVKCASCGVNFLTEIPHRRPVRSFCSRACYTKRNKALSRASP